MAVLVLDGTVHPLVDKDSPSSGGFVCVCPTCSKAWAHMTPSGRYGYQFSIALHHMPCPEHGGNVLEIAAQATMFSWALGNALVPREALIQLVMAADNYFPKKKEVDYVY